MLADKGGFGDSVDSDPSVQEADLAYRKSPKNRQASRDMRTQHLIQISLKLEGAIAVFQALVNIICPLVLREPTATYTRHCLAPGLVQSLASLRFHPCPFKGHNLLPAVMRREVAPA